MNEHNFRYDGYSKSCRNIPISKDQKKINAKKDFKNFVSSHRSKRTM